jgi:hypothetical protein
MSCDDRRVSVREEEKALAVKIDDERYTAVICRKGSECETK